MNTTASSSPDRAFVAPPTDASVREQTLASWRARLRRVTAHVVEHLDAPLNLQQLAELAHFSPFHFHRVYCAAMGEPLAETVRRMRLHRAAVLLVTSDQPIAAIAKRCAYGSVQAFARAFRQAYGTSPGQYRAHAQSAANLLSHAQRNTAKPLSPTGDTMTPFPKGLGDSPEAAVRITQLQAQRVAAMPHRGSYNAIGESFQKLTAWAIGQQVMGPGTRMFGIYYDDPASMPQAELKSEACVTVPEGFELGAADAPVHITHTAGGRAAQVVFTGPYAELDTVYRWLYSVWLPQNGHQPSNQPPIEEYLNDPRSLAPTQWQTAVSIPIEEPR